MKGVNYKEKSTTELQQLITDEQGNLHKLKMSHAVSPLENPMRIRANRKEVAKIKTELKAREIAEKKQAK